MARLRPLFSDAIDREMGFTTRVGFDPDTGRYGIERVQDVEPLILANRADFNSGHDGYSPSRDIQRVASIPLVVVEKWMKAGINIFDEDDWPKIARLLDSPEYAYLRTAPGRISRRRERRVYTGAGSHRSEAEEIHAVNRGFRDGVSW